MPRRNDKKPNGGLAPQQNEKTPRSETPNVRKMNPLWAFRDVDIGSAWCWSQMNGEALRELLKRLGNFETMTWAEFEGQTGSHFVEIDSLARKAQQRLIELRKDDITQLFSVRITGERRAWGYRFEHILRFLWYDPHHEVCPSIKKHT